MKNYAFLTIDTCKRIAKERGGECLSLEYKYGSYLKWRCGYGHEWEAPLGNIKNQYRWCPYCAGNARLTIDWFKEHAKSKGGECLSSEYKNQKTKLNFKCKEGHAWTTSAASIRNENTWCPTCSGVSKPSIESAHQLAANKLGECLSSEYINAREKLKWRCKEGHQWDATLNVVKKGHWCNICADKDRAAASNYAKIQKHWQTGEDLVCVASFEAAVVNWLNINKIPFEWQKHTFTTPIKTLSGKYSTYTPDLYLPDKNLWVEIKGWMRKDADDKWSWFSSRFPNSELWTEEVIKSKGII